MTTVLYTFERRFMRKTYEAIDRHVDAASAFVPVRPEARGCSDAIAEVDVPGLEDGVFEAVDAAVRRVDPDVVVRNHRYRAAEFAFEREYPVVHVRHGASIGRNEVELTLEDLDEVLAAALAPGEWWAEQYREGFPDRVDVTTVGIPEADELVAVDPPRERRVLYAPTNHNYGGGSYVNTAERVLDVFAGSEYELLFRPHPMDRQEEPGRSVTERCRERIADLPNVTFDASETPMASLRAADVLISDYSGIVSEWLHTDRPLIQLTDLASAENEVPAIGVLTDRPDLETVDELYADGYPERVAEREAAFRDRLGIPTDGRAGERAAREVVRCAR